MTICDGNWELIDYDAQTGRTIWHCFDENTEHFRTDYPIQNIVEQNEILFNDSQARRFEKGQRVASIPLNIFYEQLHEACLQDDMKFLNQWLNDSANRPFRTFMGQL